MRSRAKPSVMTIPWIDNLAGPAEDRPSTAAGHPKQRCRSWCRPHAPCLGSPIGARETYCCIIGVWLDAVVSFIVPASKAAQRQAQ